MRVPAPAPRSLASFLLAIVVHAAIFGIVLAIGNPGLPPGDPGETEWIPPITSYPRVQQPPGGSGGGPKGPREPKVVPKPPTPADPVTIQAPPVVVAELTEPAEPVTDGEALVASGPPNDDSALSPGTGTGLGEPGAGGDGTGPGPGGRGGGPASGAPGSGSAATPVVQRSDMIAPRLIHRVEPEYPRIASTTRQEGTVILRCIVELDGSVRVVDVKRSAGILDQAAIDAVVRWRYEPARWNGRAQAVYEFVRVDFRLR